MKLSKEKEFEYILKRIKVGRKFRISHEYTSTIVKIFDDNEKTVVVYKSRGTYGVNEISSIVFTIHLYRQMYNGALGEGKRKDK